MQTKKIDIRAFVKVSLVFRDQIVAKPIFVLLYFVLFHEIKILLVFSNSGSMFSCTVIKY